MTTAPGYATTSVMRRLRSRALTVVVALLAWSVAALLPLLHVHGGPPDTGRLTLVHLPGDGHVHIAVRDYGHADTWDERGLAGRGATGEAPAAPPEPANCPACLAPYQSVALAATSLPAIGWAAPALGWAPPEREGDVSGRRSSSPFEARAPPRA